MKNNWIEKSYFLGSILFFLPFQLHYVFFSMFVAIFFVKLSLDENKKVNKSVFFLSLLLLLFSIPGYLQSQIDSNEIITKFFIFILTLNAIIYMTRDYTTNDSVRVISKVTFVIVLLNFLQCLYSVVELNMWSEPFKSEKNSISAYLIEQSTILIGSPNKNIWASKLFMFCLPFFSLIYDRRVKFTSVFTVSLLLMFGFVMIYTQSRTTQGLLLLVCCFWLFSYIYKSKSILLKVFVILCMFFISFKTYPIVINKFLYFELDYGDGFFSRILLWIVALPNVFNNILFGFGFGSGHWLIEGTTQLDAKNFHNVFLNTVMDLGLISALALIILLFRGLTIVMSRSCLSRGAFLVIFIPVFLIFSVQYVGYDPEYLFIIFTLSLMKKDDSYYEH
ncbi:O-antigen ligase family protein [Vibrio sp. 10N.286.52.B1]|uniref:O-antigen ligase family protein n=1 Tax=Vibrio sp. 10N.286.52.B1 TaxID=3229712 RepID=UPI0035540A31